jgi:hypothetical protein
MYCPSCGSEITVELNYCNRCGANLSIPANTTPAPAPVKLTGPSIVLGLTIVFSLGIIFSSAARLVEIGLHPAALAWMVIISLATLFGCVGLLIRFWSTIVKNHRPEVMPRQSPKVLQQTPPPQQLPPRYEPGTSVTENTTRTFAPVYREPRDRQS